MKDMKYHLPSDGDNDAAGTAAREEPSAGEGPHGPGVPGPGSSSEERQRENPKTVLHLPVEPIDEAMKRAIKADGKAVHDIELDDLDGTFNALFLICGTDRQLIRALDAAYVYMIDETQYKHATVCGIGVGVAISVIGSLLAHAPDSPSGALSRSAAQVRAEITFNFPDAVKSLFGLGIERKDSAGNDGANVGRRGEAKTAPETNASETTTVHGDIPSWTVEEIQQAELEELETTYELLTEFMQAFDLLRVDDEIDGCLSPAIRTFIDCMESGKFTPAGAFIMAIRKLVNSHRVFRAYLPGPQAPWPRSSAVINAEIEERLPDALRYLRDELEVALAVEADVALSQRSSG
jgi:hypothetical protein